MTLSPEREQVLAALSEAGAFCGECGFQPGETGCADCVRVREMYADAVMPILAQQRSAALVAAVEKLTWMLDRTAEEHPRRVGLAFAIGVLQGLRDYPAPTAGGEVQ
jgi:hypothetical protein